MSKMVFTQHITRLLNFVVQYGNSKYLVLIMVGVGHVPLADAAQQLEVVLAERHVLPRLRVAHRAPEVGVFAFPGGMDW